MYKILFIIVAGIIWAWRGSRYTLGNYPTVLIASGLIVLFYNCFVLKQQVNYNVLWATLALATLEAVLGYGEATSLLNTPTSQLHKELWLYIGLISMCYAIFPYLILNRTKPVHYYFTMVIIGALAFPIAKYVDIYLQSINFQYDSWKVAEFLIWFIIGLGWIIGA